MFKCLGLIINGGYVRIKVDQDLFRVDKRGA
jgi:hypothetical protein